MSNDTFLLEMGAKIRQARKAKKMPINVLAERSKIDMSNLSFLERGRKNCHILSLKSIADVLEMDVKDFL